VKAGPLDRRIRIETATTEPDESGAEVPTWAELATVPARRLDQRPTEAWRSGGTAATLETAWVVRWSPTVATLTTQGRLYEVIQADGQDQRVGPIYSIIGPPIEQGRRDGLQIVTAAQDDRAG
jgi:head-tail adaptor